MNRRALLLIFSFLLISQLYSQNIIKEIKDRGALNIGILDVNAYPFVYMGIDRTWRGFEIIRGKEMASRLGVESKIITFTNVDEAKEALNNGLIDIYFHKRFKNLDDGLDTLITKPLATLEMVLVINRREFAGLKINPQLKKSLLDGSISVSTRDESSFIGSFYKEFPELEIDRGLSEILLWKGVESGTEISIYHDEATVKERLRNKPHLGINLAYLPLEVTQEVVALVSWKESFFLDWVNIAIEGWGDPKTLSEIMKILEGERDE